MMTWPEVKADGGRKTTALVYNGGTEPRSAKRQRRAYFDGSGDRNRHRAQAGNALAAPVLPFSPNNASAKLPGTIGLTRAVHGD